MSATQHDVAVVGAGVVGLSIALALQLQGRRVTVLDRDDPGRACSFGSAGIVCTSEILPSSSLSTVLRAPAMLLDPAAPLTIRPRYALRLAPWLARFARNATPARRSAAIRAIAALNSRALAAYRVLLGAADATDLLIERGMLKIARSTRGIRAIEEEVRNLHAYDPSASLVSAREIRELEPVLRPDAMAGAYYPAVAHVSDPYEVTSAFARRVLAGGARFHRASVHALRADARGAVLITSEGEFRADQAVISAGVWSKRLIETLGVPAPLEAERGYHLDLPGAASQASRPIYFYDESVVVTPLRNRLRLAGTAEFAGVDAPPDWRRSVLLGRVVRRHAPTVRIAPASSWMGCRPSLPDSLPAIGRICGAPPIFYAFGHRHLGLTQAPITALCIADLMHGRTPQIDLTPYSLERFR